jgi:hypothetical protein
MTAAVRNLVVRSLLVAGFVLGAVQGCASSGSSTPSCNDICVKEQMCLADASTAAATTRCNQTCAAAAGGASGQTSTCKNASAMLSALSGCFSKTDCADFNSCIGMVPKCDMGAGGAGGAAGMNGAAGASGAAGAGGAGGTGATFTCASCDKAVICCEAEGVDAGTCMMYSTADCNAATGTAQQDILSYCKEALDYGSAFQIPACL